MLVIICYTREYQPVLRERFWQERHTWHSAHFKLCGHSTSMCLPEPQLCCILVTACPLPGLVHPFASGLCMTTASPDLSCYLQHAEIAQLLDKEKQRFDSWPEKMAKLDDAARGAAESLAQLEREHQDQVGVPAVSICCNHTSVSPGHCCSSLQTESVKYCKVECRFERLRRQEVEKCCTSGSTVS